MDREITVFDGSMPHPSPDRLLPFIDGEVGEKEFTLLAAHMEACWNCRVKKARLEESIADIVDFDETLALLEVYGDGPKWSGFDRRLREAAALKANTKKRTFLEIVRGSIADRRPLKRALAYGAPVLAAALILISVFLPTMTFSAADILDRAVVADGKLSVSAERPIVQRGFVISAGGQTTKAVSWRDTVNNRSKIEIEPGSSGEGALRDIASAGFPTAGIFSAKAFLEWGKTVGTIADKPRTVSTGNGETAYEILLTPDIDEEVSKLNSASITVRAKDWVVVGHEFTFREEPSPRQISIIQEDVRMLASKDVPPGIFDDNLLPTGSETAQSNSQATTTEDNKTGEAPVAALKEKDEPAASLETPVSETEVEVLSILNSLGADLGEEITVRRTGAGLTVEGLVDSVQRKNELVAGLRKLDPKSNVKIAIQTIDEAAAKRQNAGNPRITSVDTLEFEAEGSESERELAKYFSSFEEARRFAAGVSSSSRGAMNHVYALRRLSRQFSPNEIRELSDPARSKWTGLIRSHANSYSRGLGRVSSDISRKFGGSGKGGGPVAAVSDVTQLIRNIDELQRVAAEIDRMVSSALSTSAQGRRLGDLQNARFWQLVDRAEELSASIAAYK